MKKIFFLLLLLPFLASAQKTTPGNYTYIAQRYEWIAGMFQALGLPSGSGPAAFTIGQVPRAGAVYYDSLGVDAGFYIYNGTAWVLQGTPSVVDLPDELIQPGYVIYSGTGLKFYITPSIARIDGVIYGTDQDSVTLSAADPDNPRKDVIYLATTGVEVLTGVPAGPAAEPQLEAGQIKLTVVDVPALATTPGITQQVLYDENTESTVTGFGVTVNPASTTDVYRLTVALDVGTLSNADVITLDAALPTLAWDLTGVNSLDGFIKLKAVMPTEGRLRIQLFNGSTAIGAEVNLVINKSFLDWQPFSIPISAMGNLASLSFTRVRIRYNTDAGNYAGFTLDYTYLQDGIVQPGPGGGVNSVTLQGPAGWTFTGPTTGDVIQTIIPGGTPTEMLGGDGVVKTDSAVKYIGTINSLTKSANGATINTLTNEIVFQEADAVDNGVLSAYDWRRFDTAANQTVENGDPTLDTLVYAIDAFRTGIKSIKDSTGIGVIDRGGYLAIYNTGTGGSTETASEGLTKAGNDIQLGQTIGAVGDPAIISVNREIPFSGTSYFRFKSAANEVRFNPAGAVQTYNPLGGGYHAMVNPTTATRAFPGLAIWRNTEAATAGATLLAHIGVDINQVGGAYHHLFIDVRNELDFFKIEFNGSSSSQWQNNGDAMIGGLGTKRTRFGSYVTPTRTVDITGSYAVSDSALFPNRLQITDTTGFDVAMLDRSTGLMKRIRPDQLGVGGGGGSQTLQQVFDTEVGGSVMTKSDTINAGNTNTLLIGDFAGGSSWSVDIGNSSSGLRALSSVNTAIVGISTDYAGVYGETNGTTNPGGLQGTVNNAGTNTIQTGVKAIHRNSTGAGANGIGVSYDFENETTTGAPVVSNKIIGKFTDATNGTETSEMDIEGEDAGTTKTFANIQTGGVVRVNNNADTLATKAYARSLVSSGGVSLTQYRIAVGDASNLVSDAAAITANRALISDANGVPTHSATTATELGYVNGVTSPIQTQLTNKTFAINILGLSSSTINDAATQYVGYFPAVWTTGVNTYEINIDKACTLIAANVEMQCGTAGTDEDWTTYVRVNNTTDYTISTVSVSANRRTWTNTALNTTGVTLVAGDKIVVKFINPTWATNPATCLPGGYLRFREN